MTNLRDFEQAYPPDSPPGRSDAKQMENAYGVPAPMTNKVNPAERKPLCRDAWAIPPSERMLKFGNDYYSCSKCGAPCNVVNLLDDIKPSVTSGKDVKDMDELRAQVDLICRTKILNRHDLADFNGGVDRIMALFQAKLAAAKAEAIQEYLANGGKTNAEK